MKNWDYDTNILYVAKCPMKRNFDWVEDILTTIRKQDVDYLLKVLNKHVADQNDAWDYETEDCLELLERMQSFLK
jgi:hypothetical protein